MGFAAKWQATGTTVIAWSGKAEIEVSFCHLMAANSPCHVTKSMKNRPVTRDSQIAADGPPETELTVHPRFRKDYE
jgi:hypothetical protein